MRYGKLLAVFVIILLISLAAGTHHFAATRSKHLIAMTAIPLLSPVQSGAPKSLQGPRKSILRRSPTRWRIFWAS